jgi:hypothetical protein
MSENKSNWMSLDEALDLIIARTGMSRRNAKRSLLKNMASGKIETIGVNAETGKVEQVSPSFFQGEWTDNEGDGDITAVQ